MADVITRFKLETTQYDSALRDCAKGLQKVTHQASLAGNEFDKFTKDSVQQARAFGDIATSATNAKDKVKELVSAYNDVAKSYNALTKEQQQSDFGKAMAESMNKLKGRIKEAKGEMQQMGEKTSGTGGILEQFTGKLGISTKTLGLLGAALGAGKVALDVMKDAMAANESMVDEWGRVVASSESVYEGFLTAINTGDISGYLSRIDQIVQAARNAYNELDRLGTLKTIQAPKVSAQQTENDRLRAMIQTRRYIAPVDGRKAAMANGQVLTDAQVRTLERQLQGGMQKLVGLVGNEVQQSTKAIEAVYLRQAAELGMSIEEFRKGTSSMDEFEKRLAGAAKYQQWQTEHSFVDQSSGRLVAPRGGNPYAQFKGWDVFRVDGDRFKDLVNLIKQRDQQAGQAYSMMGQAYRTMNRVEGITSRIGGGSGGGGGRGGAGASLAGFAYSVPELARTNDFVHVSPWEMMMANRPSSVTPDKGLIDFSPLEKFDIEIQALTEAMMKATDPEEYQRYSKARDSKQKERDRFTGDNKQLQELVDWGGQMMGGVNSIVSGLEGLGVEIPAGLQSILGGLNSLLSIASGISTILIAISMKPFAHGGIVRAAHGFDGIVPGTQFSGDLVPAALSSGEVVLNKAQTYALAQHLQSNSEGAGGGGISRVSGEQIYVVLNRYLRRSGRGELATWG